MLSKIIDRAKWMYADEEGATMVEYALLLALIAVVSILVITALGTNVGTQFKTTNTAVKGGVQVAP
jgi:pilus assembly protein Flp/PilA